MSERSSMKRLRRLGKELGGKTMPRVWGRRSFRQIRLRWWVPPTILVATLSARALGYEFETRPILMIAAGILAYNSLLALNFRRLAVNLEREPKRDRRLVILGVSLDYAAMFLLIHFTGGSASSLNYFFLFHVIFAAIQLRPGTAYLFAGTVITGTWILVYLQISRILPCHCMSFNGQSFCYLDRPGHLIANTLVFSATVAIMAILTSRIMARLRSRVKDLTEASKQVATLNDRFHSLYAMLRAIGTEDSLQPILDIVTRELAEAMKVKVVAVKLLSEDGRTLRFVAAHGLPEDFIEKKIVQLAESPLNREVIEGEVLMHGSIDADDKFQLHAELKELGIRSVAFAPLSLEKQVIGILGAYCYIPMRFDDEDTGFLRLAAELVAVAIESARSYEAVQELLDERSRFMLRVAHNMRAPLGASLSLLEVIRDGTLGPLTDRQSEYLSRVDLRLSNLNQTVGELLTLSRSRDLVRQLPAVDVLPADLAAMAESTFSERARGKGVGLDVEILDELPPVASHGDTLQQLVENLVSNAIKYTGEGGGVAVTFSRQGEWLRIEVADDGIGIPAAEQAGLFNEFFRASNAKKLAVEGTGLGLLLAKQTAERHGGSLRLASEEGVGTTVVVDLPFNSSVS
jgi:signal transduction histidine kinase